jgi:hypothetical protein
LPALDFSRECGVYQQVGQGWVAAEGFGNGVEELRSGDAYSEYSVMRVVRNLVMTSVAVI